MPIRIENLIREALADSLVRLLDDETLRARLGKRGRFR